ncbi:MAG: PhnD/SsuA/transferrin family substrate-binding protein [Planctomycetales bacterium]|nr:PhnD/SsuA/transferrin family substrate-binding protein [Planctomycetales bacterium]
MSYVFHCSAVVIALLSFLNVVPALTISAGESSEANALTLVVMDPMAAPLACDCVKGYAQRKYESLGAFLNKQLGRKVNVVWAESLEAALEKSEGKADLIIGKHSVVLADAAEAKLDVTPLAQLTDLKDQVTQTGLIVVRKDDAARSVDDLKGYRILFGPADCDEKSAAPVELLRKHGIQLPDELETSPSCSNAAVALMEMSATTKASAVISSYAEPLLEGCGKVKKGDLRVIGESNPVPFITLFARASLSATELSKLSNALDEAGLDAQLLIDLETASGFVPWKEAVATSSVVDDAKKK